VQNRKSKNRNRLSIYISIILLLLCGCTLDVESYTVRDFHPHNLSSYKYYLKSNNLTLNSNLKNNGDFNSIYQANMGSVFFSKCRNAPSDSEYLNLLSNENCNSYVSLARAVGRMVKENDLYYSHPNKPIIYNNSLVWVDLTHCNVN
jgi:hypothetical protein|tara:strand:+ start:642 stop:1082 length:441 start_codon:yes stop_codon:yes gene_type:complete